MEPYQTALQKRSVVQQTAIPLICGVSALQNNGELTVPDGPGLGFEPDEAYLKSVLMPGEQWWGGSSVHGGRSHGGSGAALDLQRLQNEGELVDAPCRQILQPQVLQQMNSVHHQHDLVYRQRQVRIRVR